MPTTFLDAKIFDRRRYIVTHPAGMRPAAVGHPTIDAGWKQEDSFRDGSLFFDEDVQRRAFTFGVVEPGYVVVVLICRDFAFEFFEAAERFEVEEFVFDGVVGGFDVGV